MTLLVDLLEVAVAGLELLEVAVRAAGRAGRRIVDLGRRVLGRDSSEQDDRGPAARNAAESPTELEREREH